MFLPHSGTACSSPRFGIYQHLLSRMVNTLRRRRSVDIVSIAGFSRIFHSHIFWPLPTIRIRPLVTIRLSSGAYFHRWVRGED